MAMDAEELNAAIWQAHGWERHSEHGIYRRKSVFREYEFDYVNWVELPDYTHSVASVYALEETIPSSVESGWVSYIKCLLWVFRYIDPTFTSMGVLFTPYEILCLVHATAEQRARAWLIWKESEK
jgi:hypothetical protein